MPAILADIGPALPASYAFRVIRGAREDPHPAPAGVAGGHRARGRGLGGVHLCLGSNQQEAQLAAERVRVLPVLDIILTYNTGAAFSFLADASGWQRWLFVLLALGVSAALIVWMRRLSARIHGLLACGLALIVGGALGNMIDRLTTGRVVDFIHVHWGRAYFPAFNIADSAITIGAALLLLDAWRESRTAKRPKT